jgi:hypothetical protein
MADKTGYQLFDDQLQGLTAHQVHAMCRKLMCEISDERLRELASEVEENRICA